ncbi:MAG TPA: hypothetical protein VGS41_02485, partial [Chthonomonadales bacterium]|nr:hypothetical protein [Chthonomonadales bacterium]
MTAIREEPQATATRLPDKSYGRNGDSPGPRPQSLRRNLLWMMTGTMTFGICQWAQLLVIARLGTLKMLGE